MKTAAFTVRATEKQSLRWKRAADAEGHASVGGWLAEAADRHLAAVQRAGKPVPLGWRRFATFSVQRPQGEPFRVRGYLSHPFGFYRGTEAKADRCSHFYTLVYVPDGRIIATLKSAVQCRTLAADLARLWVRWGGEQPVEDPGAVVGRHARESV